MESLSNYGGLTGPASAAGGYFLSKNNPAIFSQDLGTRAHDHRRKQHVASSGLPGTNNVNKDQVNKMRNNHFEMPRATATFNVSDIDNMSQITGSRSVAIRQRGRLPKSLW